MNKIIYILICLLVLGAYGDYNIRTTKSDAISKDEENEIKIQYNYIVKGGTTDEFELLIKNNPIDLRYSELIKDYDGSSEMIKRLNNEYMLFWDNEIDQAYSNLLKILKNKDLQLLIDSQINWESYIENKIKIENSFYEEMKYNKVGTLRAALRYDEIANETRVRALTLLEYLYIINGEIKMVFKREEWKQMH